MNKLLVDAANRTTQGQRQTKSRQAGWFPSMTKYTAALKFLQKSKDWQTPWLQKQLPELPQEQQYKLPSPWGNSAAVRGPKGVRKAWLQDTQTAGTKIRRALSEA